MLKMIISVFSFVLNAQAFDMSFSCTNAENHKLQISVDSSVLNSLTNSPQIAEIQFVFDGQKYFWKNLQYLSLPLGNGETATEFKRDAVNTLYIQQSQHTNQATAELKLERENFELDCIKFSHQ